MEGDIGNKTTMETRVRTFVIRFEWRSKWNERNNMGMDYILFVIEYFVEILFNTYFFFFLILCNVFE